MVTNTRLRLELEADRPEVADDWLSRFFQRASRRAGQLRCGITGHNILMRYQPTRLSLQCTMCGYESPGWDLERGRVLSEKGASDSWTVLEPGATLRPRATPQVGPPVAA